MVSCTPRIHPLPAAATRIAGTAKLAMRTHGSAAAGGGAGGKVVLGFALIVGTAGTAVLLGFLLLIADTALGAWLAGGRGRRGKPSRSTTSAATNGPRSN